MLAVQVNPAGIKNIVVKLPLLSEIDTFSE
jgi:hypothetical protein